MRVESQEAVSNFSSTEYVPDTIAANLIGSTAATLRRWRYEDRGPRYCRVGANIRYKVSWLEEFIAQHIVETRDTAALPQNVASSLELGS